MSASDISDRLQIIDRIEGLTVDSEFADAVRVGLTGRPKTLPCRYFYDEVGSQLFEQICELPEYYLTRAETEILTYHGDEIVAGLADDLTLVELGSGSAVKTRLLIEALIKRQETLRFTPIDVSRTALEQSADELLQRYGSLEIVAVLAEYAEGIAELNSQNNGPELILWLGSSIGNLTRNESAGFLGKLASQMSTEDRLLIGIDLRKSASVLEPAYDDAAGVTSAFNLNVLARVNAELDADFDLTSFNHVARYDEVEGRVEMHLESAGKQMAKIGALDLEVSFTDGETIHTENSYKYSLEEIDQLVDASGLSLDARWFDDEKRFSLNMMMLPAGKVDHVRS